MSLAPVEEKKEVSVSELIAFSAFHHLPFAAYRLPGNAMPELICSFNPDLKKMNMGEDFTDEHGFIMRSGSVNGFFQTVIPSDIFFSGEILTIAAGKENAFEKLWNDFKRHRLSDSFTLPHTKDLYETGKEEFCRQVETIQRYIRSGKIRKAILSRVRLLPKPEKFSVVDIFEKLCHKYPDAFVSLISAPGLGCWMGASPELLLSLNENILQTVSLAGTRRMVETNQQSASYNQQLTNVWSEKETEEQAIVSDYILNCLKKFFAKDITIDGPTTSLAGAFAHLKSIFTIKGENENLKKNFSPLIDQLHPTPAISGFPKSEALEVISNVEKHDRELYAGFLGPINRNSQTNLFVNLRCMQLFEHQIALYAGAGITAGSNPEMEWEETELKTRTIVDVLK